MPTHLLALYGNFPRAENQFVAGRQDPANHCRGVKRVGDFLGGRFPTVPASTCSSEGLGQSWAGRVWKLPPSFIN